MLLIIHTIFEFWELWGGGYIGINEPAKYGINFEEIVDIIMDTIFTTVGYLLFYYEIILMG